MMAIRRAPGRIVFEGPGVIAVGAYPPAYPLLDNAPTPRLRRRTVMFVVALVIALTCTVAANTLLRSFLESTPPHVAEIDLYAGLVDATPVTITLAANERIYVANNC